MKKLLYYDNPVSEDFKDKVVHLGVLINKVDNIDEIEYLSDELNGFYIDISNIFYNGGINPIYAERYLDKLFDKYNDVIFICNSRRKEEILDILTNYFREIDELDIGKEDDLETVEPSLENNDQNVEKIDLIIDYKPEYIDNILSIANLLDVNYNLDPKMVASLIGSEEKSIFNITPMLEYISVHRDKIFSFEVIFRALNKIDNIKLISANFSAEDIEKLLPYTFNIIESNNDLEEPKSEISADELFCTLDLGIVGHDTFKKDFIKHYKMFTDFSDIISTSILSIFLSGPSGIGKTEFAKVLSKSIYPGEELIKINFGNYNSNDIINTLIGSPKGYVGSQDGGELINKISKSKSKIILIDEFEKANHDIFNFFYELLEDGSFTDRLGKLHDLNGYIIIFTSNLTQDQFINVISDPLKSRLDMIYYFNHISTDDKLVFIESYYNQIRRKISEEKNIDIPEEMNYKIQIKCVNEINLRDIKRIIDTYSFEEYEKIIIDN